MMSPRLISKALFAALLITSMSLTTSSWGSASLESLKGVSVPSDSELSTIVKDYDELVALGKALFWDQQAGIDGQACATCHFHAGADSRFKNQLSPHGASGTTGFGPTRSGGGSPNYLMKSEDWPLFELYDKSDRDSGVVFDTDDVVSSSGVFKAVQTFDDYQTGEDSECSQVYDEFFNVDGVNTRRVEPRNAPTVINSGFAFRLFWDGRANNQFNGVDPFGKRNENARVFRNSNGQYIPEKISLKNSALASLSVGPPVSLFEMNCQGRTFSQIGRKLLNVQPLNGQEVHPDDSVLGQYANPQGSGLNSTYGDLIEKAIKDEWWNGSSDLEGYSHKETNFSLYWGLALQAYQASLVSDDAPIDRYLDGASNHGMSDAALRGMGVFLSDGKCIACHKGPDMTAAGHVLQSENEEGGLVERMHMGHLGSQSDSDNFYNALYDNGFYNIGVAPTSEDIGLGGLDPWGNPLSFTRQEKDRSVHYLDRLAREAEWCANHGQTCHIPSGATATIWYGSHEAGKWSVLFNQTGSKICRNVPNGWGDPAPGFAKHCRIVINEFSDHVPSSYAAFCSNENGTCSIPAGQKATVWFGKHSSWTAKSDLTGVVSCSNEYFGDPLYGTLKECRVETTHHDSLAVPTADSLHCANDYGWCNLGTLIPDTIWYGKDDNWTALHDQTGWISCTGSTFGVTPIYGATCRNYQPSNYVGPSDPPMPPGDAVHCANQGQHCYVPDDKVATIWYGADSRWTMRSGLTGSVACTNENLPDAAEYSGKTCKIVFHSAPDPFFVDASKLEVDSGISVDPNERDAVDGSFKTSSLRNVELTGPYFHNGGQLTLRQVVEFYNRGGDRQRTTLVDVRGRNCDTTGFDQNCTNVDPDIESLSLSDSQIDDLVAFLEALTDDRVREEKAPFDHPSLTLPLGHTGDEYTITPVGTASGGTVAEDALFVLPAVGRDGRTADGRRPLPRVDQLVSCADASGDIVECFDEAYNSTDYVPPEPEPTGPRVEFTHVYTVDLYPQYPWLNYWQLTVQGVVHEIPPGHYVKLYSGDIDQNGHCTGPLIANVLTNNPFSYTFTRTTLDTNVCISNYYTREALGESQSPVSHY